LEEQLAGKEHPSQKFTRHTHLKNSCQVKNVQPKSLLGIPKRASRLRICASASKKIQLYNYLFEAKQRRQTVEND
jgi:hypothetical protein